MRSSTGLQAQPQGRLRFSLDPYSLLAYFVNMHDDTHMDPQSARSSESWPGTGCAGELTLCPSHPLSQTRMTAPTCCTGRRPNKGCTGTGTKPSSNAQAGRREAVSNIVALPLLASFFFSTHGSSSLQFIFLPLLSPAIASHTPIASTHTTFLPPLLPARCTHTIPPITLPVLNPAQRQRHSLGRGSPARHDTTVQSNSFGQRPTKNTLNYFSHTLRKLHNGYGSRIPSVAYKEHNTTAAAVANHFWHLCTPYAVPP